MGRNSDYNNGMYQQLMEVMGRLDSVEKEHKQEVRELQEELSDLKKENKGGFSKRLILERTYKFQNSSEEKTLSLEELVEHINSDDDEEFELELHPKSQELKLSNNK